MEYSIGNITQMKSSDDVWDESYENYFRFYVSPSQINNMEQYASGYVSAPDAYDLLNHNCYDYIVDVLAAGNVTLQNDAKNAHPNIPNDRYNETYDASNAQGFYKGSF